MKGIQGQGGYSMVSILIGAGISVALASFVARTTIRGQTMQKKTSLHVDVAVIKKTVSEQLDCRETLGVNQALGQPLNCRNFRGSIPIRRADGSVLNPNRKLGDWTLSASCPRIGGKDANEIVIALSKEGVDPVTKKPWSQMRYASDLYGGTSDFCQDYFLSDDSQSDGSPDLDCFWGYRDKNGIATEGRNRYRRYLSTFNGRARSERWYGLRCAKDYHRTGCSLRTIKSTGDYDVRYIDRGCFTDDEEWEDEAKLYINCCKLAKS